MQGAFEQIEWPKRQPLKDLNIWKVNVNLVKLLAELCSEVTEWVNGVEGVDTYTHMAYAYQVEGVTIRFLPHWGYYEVGGVELPIPYTKDAILRAVAAVKVLKELGLQE